MRHVTICVVPLGEGWAVEQEDLAESLVFISGGRAEAAARKLARATSRAGMSAEIVIHDRNGQVVGRQRYSRVTQPSEVSTPP